MSRRYPTPEEWTANSLPFESALNTIELDYPFLYTHFFDLLLRCALHIFEVESVPDSVNYEFMKMCIVTLGRVAWFDQYEGELLAMNCAPAGKPDLYYVPENLLITNPRFNRSYNLKVGQECEIVYCTSLDPYYWGRGSGGLYSLISSTASLLADNYLSLNIAQKNTRLTNAFAADDENTVESLNACMEEAYEGRPFLVVQKSLIDKLETLPMTNTSDAQTLIQMLDIHKYILSEFYAAIGLKEAQQMKRERLITSEVEEGAELPLFNIQDMIQTITAGFERVNALFGTDMQVKINPLILQNLYGDQSAEDQSAEDPEDQPAELPALDPEPEPAAEPEPEPEPDPEPAEDAPEEDQPAEPEDLEPEPAADVLGTASDILDDISDIIDFTSDIIEGMVKSEPEEGDSE